MSKTITVETNINASIDDVWSEVSLIENHSNWMNDAEEINFQSTTKSGVGTEIKVLTKIGPIKLYDYKEKYLSHFSISFFKFLRFSFQIKLKIGFPKNSPIGPPR